MKTSLFRFVLVAVLSSALGACGGGGTGGEGGEAKTGGAEGAHSLVGAPGPDFAVESVNGQGKISFKGLEGKVVLVDFWATWCEPCKKSFPKLQGLHTKYKSNGFEIVAVSEDDEKSKDIQDFGTTYGAKFAIGWDDGKNIAKKWEPKSMPSSFVVDRKGVVRFVHLGYHDGEEDELEKEIKSLL
ncbi:TlpA family protein disulfide reductase [Pendulispora brunnea]|uniref:TlpA family protein disulfide reductase n=1 Tax=Pendulispora brunnea TaxID=2905690 RepID=A0ABZ2KG04_9BACT